MLPGGGGGARFIPPDEYKEFLNLGHGVLVGTPEENVKAFFDAAKKIRY